MYGGGFNGSRRGVAKVLGERVTRTASGLRTQLFFVRNLPPDPIENNGPRERRKKSKKNLLGDRVSEKELPVQVGPEVIISWGG